MPRTGVPPDSGSVARAPRTRFGFLDRAVDEGGAVAAADDRPLGAGRPVGTALLQI